jgi:hypothetical protein
MNAGCRELGVGYGTPRLHLTPNSQHPVFLPS